MTCLVYQPCQPSNDCNFEANSLQTQTDMIALSKHKQVKIVSSPGMGTGYVLKTWQIENNPNWAIGLSVEGEERF